MTKKPATPLPWHFGITENGTMISMYISKEDGPCARHACNKYSQLVKALRCVANGERRTQQMASALLRELGEG